VPQSQRHATALAALPGPDATTSRHPGEPDGAGTTRVVRPDEFRGPPLRGPQPRRRVLLPAFVVLLVLVLAAAVTLLVRGDLPWVSAATGGTPPEPSTGPEAPARTLLITDPLAEPRLWQPSADAKEKAACEFSGGALVVSRQTVGSFRCRGPADAEPNDLQTEVNVRLLSPGSCAGIWFWFKPYSGYQVRICEKAVLVGTHKDADAEVLRTFPLDGAPVPVGGPATRVTVTTRGGVAEVHLDGEPVGSVPLTDPDITGGRVVFGLFTEPKRDDHTPPYRVAFDRVDIYALTP
jgi:hypothetical protein